MCCFEDGENDFGKKQNEEWKIKNILLKDECKVVYFR